MSYDKQTTIEEEEKPDNTGSLSVPLEQLVSRVWVLAYADDGPSGMCGQSCNITMPWRKLFFFESYEKLKEVSRKIEDDKSRKNSRVIGIYHPEPYAAGEINFIRG
jgi:hypothetical protein